MGTSSGADPDEVAPVGFRDVGDADRRRVSHMHGRAVGVGETRRGRHRLRDHAGGHRPHRDHHRAVKAPRRTAGDRGLPHRDILALVDVTQRDAGVEKRPLEGERAAQEERHEVVAPERGDVGHLVGHHAVLVDAVPRHVGPEVGARSDPGGFGRARVGHFDERARPRVALAEQEEIVGLLLRQDGEVGLDEARGQARGHARKLAAANIGPDLSWMTRINWHDWPSLTLAPHPTLFPRERRLELHRLTLGEKGRTPTPTEDAPAGARGRNWPGHAASRLAAPAASPPSLALPSPGASPP